jgi:hypothetical protein
MSRKPGFDFWGYIAKKVDAKERELGLDPEPYPLVGVAGLPGLRIPLSGSALGQAPSNFVASTPTQAYATPQALTPAVGDLQIQPLQSTTVGSFLVVAIVTLTATTAAMSAIIDKPLLKKFGLVGDEIITARWISIEVTVAAGETISDTILAMNVIKQGQAFTDARFRELFYSAAGKQADFHNSKNFDAPLDLYEYLDGNSIYEFGGDFSAAVQSKTITGKVCLEILGRHKFA